MVPDLSDVKFLIKDMGKMEMAKTSYYLDARTTRCLVWFPRDICSTSPIPLRFYGIHSSHCKVNKLLSYVWLVILLLSPPPMFDLAYATAFFLAAYSPPASVNQVLLSKHSKVLDH